jgi:protein-disulfide isomerase
MAITNPPRTLVLITTGVIVVLSALVVYLNQSTLPEGLKIDITGQPTVGYPKAVVSLVVFEEPKCSNCKVFNTTVVPEIKRDFIETNKIRYTVIPVSFLPNSMPAAVALLCAFHKDSQNSNNDLFFTFLDYMYLHQPPEYFDWATIEKLQEMAKAASPAISLKKLQSCVEHDSYRNQIVKNTEYGGKIMNGTLSTPTVFVDGIITDDNSFESIKELVEKALKQKGVQ